MQDHIANTLHEAICYPFGRKYWSRAPWYSYFRFTGKEFDGSNGMYYFGARYYMPEFGIFITPEQFKGTESYNLDDPLSLKFYDYCRNNPYRFIDPDGKWYTYQEGGITYLRRYSPTSQLCKTIVTQLPYGSFVGLFDFIARKQTGDISLSALDFPWTMANIVAGAAKITVTAMFMNKIHRLLYNITWDYDMERTYGAFGEYAQAKYLDAKIFELLIENNPQLQLQETNLGSVSQIQLPEMSIKKQQMFMEQLFIISNSEAYRLNKENPWLKWLP